LIKSNKVEIEERILYISQLLLEGKRTKEICRNMSEKWNISRRQVERYITSSYKLWHKEFKNKTKIILDYHLALRMNLYRIAYEQENYRFCLTTLKDVAKLEGLYDIDTPAQQDTIIVKIPEDLET
jgi:hypothetical protein